MSANVKKCAVVVCKEDNVNPVSFSWKWGEDELPIVDRYTYLGVEISKDCSWDTHVVKVVGKGNAHVGKMDAILTESHLDTRIKTCILTNVIVPTLGYAVGDLDLPKRRKSYTSSREGGEVEAQVCPCDTAIE